MSASEPTSDFEVAICHGSWHTEEQYQPLVDALKKRKITSHCPKLPTSGLVPKPKESLSDTPHPRHSDDALVFRATLEQLSLESGQKVVVIAHSTGGIPATEAVTPNLEYKARKAKGLSGGVLGIFYMCAWVVPPGQSMDDYFNAHARLEEDILAHYDFKKETLPFRVVPKDSADFIFHDLPEDEAKRWASTLVEALPAPQNSRLTNVSYMRVPCAYLFTMNDKATPTHMQEPMVAKMRAVGAQVKEYRYEGGHSPHISWTDGTGE